MVDFGKEGGGGKPAALVDPIALYSSLDRASDKGPLRPIQVRTLSHWHEHRRAERDIILKLHTGQGKTLIGLLMLQSKLNEGKGPALYLCPNRFLVEQTILQAEQFGIRCSTTTGDLPTEFLEGHSILVATVHKLFNGETRFGLGHRSISVGTILLDDSHSCIDAIRDQCTIQIPRAEGAAPQAYSELINLFRNELRAQGDGTFADIVRGESSAYLPVPYWAWVDRVSEVATILSKYSDTKSIRFAWPILKDMISHTICLVSGDTICISPYVPPLDRFGSYWNAAHRIFMSATTTDDSFLVRGLGLKAATIKNPLIDAEEKWSGEKMVLIPSLIDDSLTRARIVELLARENPKRTFGVVALTPSAKRCADWNAYGARVVDTTTIASAIKDLKARTYSKTIVIANYYDGLDLPDAACRILVLDSKPYAEDLVDRYAEDRRTQSAIVAGRVLRTIEQGMGRAVRGEKDYCIVVLIGPDLVRCLLDPTERKRLSDQTRTQIEIGRRVADLSKKEISAGKPANESLIDLMNQCLLRDDGWKKWYAEQMDAMAHSGSVDRDALLSVFEQEREAELEHQAGFHDKAIKRIQRLIDEVSICKPDLGWYLQELARYRNSLSKAESNELQRVAHQKNRSLLRPREGMHFQKVETLTPEKRIERIVSWVKQFDTFESLMLRLDELLSDLQFGVPSERFEEALKNVAAAIGLASDRPDKEWKEGPDNLVALNDNAYLLIECKNEVNLQRAEIHESETEQMNRSIAWFKQQYAGATALNVMIIPTNRLAKDAALIEDTVAMRPDGLTALAKNIRGFFGEFRSIDLRDISIDRVARHLRTHELNADDLRTKYTKTIPRTPHA